MKFLVTKVVLMLILLQLFGVDCSAQKSDQNSDLQNRIKAYEGILLDVSNTKLYREQRIISGSWITGLDSSKKVTKEAGIVQLFTVKENSISLRIKYTIFADSSKAEKAIMFHIGNLFVPVSPETWSGIKLKHKAETIFFSENAVFFRQDNICVIVSGHGDNLSECRKQCLAHVDKILNQIIADNDSTISKLPLPH